MKSMILEDTEVAGTLSALPLHSLMRQLAAHTSAYTKIHITAVYLTDDVLSRGETSPERLEISGNNSGTLSRTDIILSICLV